MAGNRLLSRYSVKVLGLVLSVTVLLTYIVITAKPQRTFTETKISCDVQHIPGPFPHKIHQIWTDENLPPRWQRASESCKTLYAEYEYKLWTYSDMDDFIAEYYPWFLSTFRDYPTNAQRVDASKYFLIYHYGGLYLDADVSCNKSFHKYLSNISSHTDKNILARLADPKGIGAEIIIAKPRTKFMQFVTHQLIPSDRSYIFPYATVMFTTGPHWFGSIYDSYPCKRDILVVPEEFYTMTYFIHHHNSGWHGWDGVIITSVYYNLTLFIILGFVLLIFISAIGLFCCITRLQASLK